MQTNLEDIIRAYLNNQLPPEEKQTFEQRLSDDPVFAAQAAEVATLQAAIQEAGDQELEAQLTTYSKELKQMDATVFPSPAPNINIRKLTSYSRIVYAAAVLIGLIVIVLPLWLMNRSGTSVAAVTTEEIYAANFTIPPVPEARSNDKQSAWRQSYGQGDYKTAVTQLEALLADATFTGRSEAYLHLGIAQLALGNADDALPALTQVREESFDWESAQWYSALALLKLKRLDAAKQILHQISKQNMHPHHKQAKSVLERL